MPAPRDRARRGGCRGYALAPGGTVGLLPTAFIVPGVVIGSLASIGMLAIFFHPWLTLGLVIDLALLWAVLASGWLPAGLER
jgi:hypothetical protein